MRLYGFLYKTFLVITKLIKLIYFYLFNEGQELSIVLILMLISLKKKKKCCRNIIELKK